MTYRLPSRLPYLTAALACVLFLALLGPNKQGGHISFAGFLLGCVMVLSILGAAVAAHRFTVTIAEDRIIVRIFTTREFQFSDITEISVGLSKGGPYARVRFKNGKSAGFPGYMQNFTEFVNRLRAATKLPKKPLDLC